MKNIDIKSLIIGALLTSTIFIGVAATGKRDKWDDEQKWFVGWEEARDGLIRPDAGAEPFAATHDREGNTKKS